MYKKFFAVLLAVSMVLSLAAGVSAAGAASGTCGVDAYWSYADGKLTISGTGAMYDSGYNPDGSINAPWSGFAEEITTVVIEDGITEIGEMNFRDLSTLYSITIADSVTAIGNWAFWGCESLETIDLPDHLTRLGQEAFKYCSGLRSIEIPASVTYLGGGVFEFCTAMTKAYFHSDPDLPGFTTAHSIFPHCRSLEEIRVEEGHVAMKSIDGVLYLYDEPSGALTLTNYPIGRKDAAFRIPDGTVAVGQLSMRGCPHLETVVFPDSVTKIETLALSGCHNLKTVRFEGSAPELEAQVFDGCNLTAYYPVNDSSWDVIDSWSEHYLVGGPMIGGLQGSIEWVPYDPANPFTDVPVGAFYETPVLWALEQGITSGASATTFNPTGDCLRAQVVTFLWRAQGCPEPTTTVNPFEDVKPSDFYYDAVLWAVENSITNGADATHFNPMGVCNRAQVVTFLHRAFGSPAVEGGDSTFTDVPAGAWYAAPIAWAVEQEITNGMGGGLFGVNDACNRAQIVTFLYRACN